MLSRATLNATSGALQAITSAALLFFLYRYLLSTLGAEQLGVWSIVVASVSVGRLTDLGFAGTALKFVASALGRGDSDKAMRVIGTAAISIGVLMLTVLMLTLPFLDTLLAAAIPPTAHQLALQAMPYAMTSLAISVMGGIFQYSLDACQRMYIRNAILVAGNVSMAFLAVVLTPRMGVLGVAIAQCLQALLVLALSVAFLFRHLPDFSLRKLGWHRAEFLEMLGYATNFQVGMVVGMFFDPATKVLMGKYASLSSVAYYDMANQVVQKLRTMVISAQQSLVPMIAQTASSDLAGRRILVSKAYAFSASIGFAVFFLMAMSFPLISVLWIGHYQAEFVTSGLILSIGWMVSTISAVGYFYNQGAGSLTPNTLSHIATGLLNVVLGVTLGAHFGLAGIATAAAIAIAIPSLPLIVHVFRQLKLPLPELFPKELRGTFAFLSVAGLSSIVLGHIFVAERNLMWVTLLIGTLGLLWVGLRSTALRSFIMAKRPARDRA